MVVFPPSATRVLWAVDKRELYVEASSHFDVYVVRIHHAIYSKRIDRESTGNVVKMSSHNLETLSTDSICTSSIRELARWKSVSDSLIRSNTTFFKGWTVEDRVHIHPLICSSFVHRWIWRFVNVRRIQHPTSRFTKLVVCILFQDDQIRIGLDLDEIIGQIRICPDLLSMTSICNGLRHRTQQIVCMLGLFHDAHAIIKPLGVSSEDPLKDVYPLQLSE